MRFIKERFLTFHRALLLAYLSFLATRICDGQVQQESASTLIRFLTHQTDRPGKQPVGRSLTSCGDRGDRATAVSLAKLGKPTTPLLEKALDSIEKFGIESEFAHGTTWLCLAYARIMGAAALPRLRRMIDNPKLAGFRIFMDDSVALSLGLTSYVTDLRETGPIIHCSRLREPRDGLDQLIVAWKKNDRQTLENYLGPKARAALKSLLNGRDWESIRGELWVSQLTVGAVGYRFDITGRWSEAEETLEPEKAYPAVALRQLSNPELVTYFKNRSGKDCGSHRVSFLKTVEEYPQYLIDNADLGQLLSLIATCATSN